VARHHFISQVQTFGSDDQRNDHLAAVRTMIPAMAELGFGNFLRLALDVSAGQVVKQHFISGAEEILPARLQVSEQSRAMLQQTVEHQVKLVFAAPMKIRTEQIAHGTAVIPLAMTTPFGARSNQPVSGGNLEQARPISAF